MNAKHTPGPWTVGDSLLIYDDDAREVAIPSGRTEENLKANAHLIAAAPKLLAALDDLLNFEGLNCPNEEDLKNAYRAGRAAIAKAKGEA